MTSRLMLISHAATPAVRAAAFPLDERIDEAARKEAEALAASLPTFRTAWTSPSRRTTETAEALNLDAKIEALLSNALVVAVALIVGGMAILAIEWRVKKGHIAGVAEVPEHVEQPAAAYADGVAARWTARR